MRAVILGCSGTRLTDDERVFFRDVDPLGFILFARNIDTPEQARRLVDELRMSVGRAEAPVLIDQEGGRVVRLKPPHWRKAPPARLLGELYERDPERGLEATRLNSRLLAADVASIGCDVDCLPVLDIAFPETHAVIGDRAYTAVPESVAALGRAAAEGLLAGGVLPVIKHIPGHGRATVDSHHALPRVDASRTTLAKSDFAPFKALADMPWAMTAHIVYADIDAATAATLSRRVVTEVIRGEIGFDGVLVSDDLSMRALGGSFADRAAGALAAGCDLVLHCNGDMTEMTAVAGAASRLTPAARRRIDRAEARRNAAQPIDRETLAARFDALMARAA